MHKGAINTALFGFEVAIETVAIKRAIRKTSMCKMETTAICIRGPATSASKTESSVFEFEAFRNHNINQRVDKPAVHCEVEDDPACVRGHPGTEESDGNRDGEHANNEEDQAH